MTLRQEVLDYTREKYDTSSEHLWKSQPTYEVLRHENIAGEKKAKWYGIIMDVKASSLGLPGDEYIDILDVKLEPDTVAFLRNIKGYLPAYHMNKQNWITILLDGTVSMEKIRQHIDESFVLTASSKEQIVNEKRRRCRESPRLEKDPERDLELK